MKKNVLFEMIKYFKNDAVRINHALKVYGFAGAISASENISGIKKDTVEIAAILHDIGIIEAELKYNSTAGNYQEIEGPPIAAHILEVLGVPGEIIERVCFLIGNHHSYKKIDDIDFQILVEADFIVNIFEDNNFMKNIETIKNRYFKTEAGKHILNSMYLE